MSEDFKIQLVDPKNPALHSIASVNPFDDKNADWEKREEEMIQLMKDRFGIGLASPQLGMGYRMFVMTFASGEDVGVFNPEILEFSKEEVAIEEGCLTFPLLYFIVTRPAKVKVKFQTHDQQVVEDWLEGMDARCFQHELDHLNGKLYLEYASDMKLKRAIKKRDKQFKILQNDLALQQLENGT
jgi:peptide deformylase